MRNNLLEAIGQLQGGGSVVSELNEKGTARVKIVLNKRQLSQLMMLMSSNKNRASSSTSPPPSSTLEQRLRAMQRRHRSRALETTKGSRGGPWRPALQSIPEEL
ncbi:hypothetical protein ACLOJK_002271 [Asimina triloba]